MRRLPGDRLPVLRHVIVVGEDVPKAAVSWDAFLAAGNAVSDATIRDAAAAVKPDDLLLIQFTSGTTAYPKGVMLTHDNMLRNAWAAGSRIGVRADDRYFNCRPFFHVGGSTLSALVSLVFGACLVTLPTFEAGAALALMARERCTLISGNDTLFQMLMSHADFDRSQLAPPRRLGGGRAGDDAQDRGRARHRGDLRRLRPVGSLAERRDERLPRFARASHRGARPAARRPRAADRRPRYARSAAAGHPGRDPGARLERDARLLQQPGGERQGVHPRRLAADRRPRRRSPPTAGCGCRGG